MTQSVHAYSDDLIESLENHLAECQPPFFRGGYWNSSILFILCIPSAPLHFSSPLWRTKKEESLLLQNSLILLSHPLNSKWNRTPDGACLSVVLTQLGKIIISLVWSVSWASLNSQQKPHGVCIVSAFPSATFMIRFRNWLLKKNKTGFRPQLGNSGQFSFFLSKI